MATIEEQLDLERSMQEKGVERYKATQRGAEAHGRGSELDYSRRLMADLLYPLVTALEAGLEYRQKASAGGSSRALLRRIAPEAAMFIALKCVFNSFTLDEKVVSLASRIGTQIEDEVRFSRFQALHQDYYNKIVSDFKRKGTKDYRFMHRVMTHNANRMADGWNSWSVSERVKVGVFLLEIILANSDLVEKRTRKNKRKEETYLSPTSVAKAWIEHHEEVAQFLWPDKMPCVIPPDDWTSLFQGGYYSPNLRQTTPMVKVSGKLQQKKIEEGDLSLVMQSLNSLQAVPWAVNEEVLEVANLVWMNNLGTGMPPTEKLVPSANPLANVLKEEMDEEQLVRFADWKREAAEVYTQEKERIARSFQVSRILRMANVFQAHRAFWFVWYCDFRGRLYTATAGFSPQGPDLAKGLLRFREAVPLGKTGLRWLKIHGANRYGFDKASFDERVAWVDERHDAFMAAAEAPLEHRAVWGEADKPWQFLAFLFEYRRVHLHIQSGKSANTFKSTIRVGLDGSCNGLQNFSAMLRDERGGRATNLVPQERPADIYQEVAQVCHKKLKPQQDDVGKRWKAFCKQYGANSLPRDTVKRPVMTLPYGATRNSCTRYIFKSILDIDREFFKESNFSAACYLTPLLWESIGEVVVAAREAMSWLQRCAGLAAKAKLPLIWTTADGFVAVQKARKVKTKQIETQLNGRFQIKIGEYTDEIDAIRQRQGISPNFIHSQDATHLRSTVRQAVREGITSIDVIHDDFGTHAGNTEKLHAIIRDAFVGLYAAGCPLQAFADEQVGVELPAIPAKGTLDIYKVRESLYFFN